MCSSVIACRRWGVGWWWLLHIVFFVMDLGSDVLSFCHQSHCGREEAVEESCCVWWDCPLYRVWGCICVVCVWVEGELGGGSLWWSSLPSSSSAGGDRVHGGGSVVPIILSAVFMTLWRALLSACSHRGRWYLKWGCSLQVHCRPGWEGDFFHCGSSV